MAEPDQEPSMEEILASIKRVIAEDGRARLREGAARPVRGVPPPPPEDVLELDTPVGEEGGDPDELLLSDEAAQSSRRALATLAEARERAGPAAEAALEAMVREMLRPMLKQWLDERLPEMVDELVSREIARITGKAR